MQLLIFGSGLFYENRRDKFKSHNIIGFIDNNPQKWGQQLDHAMIFKPCDGISLNYDKIILMSKSAGQMRKQLTEEFGIKADNMLSWKEYACQEERSHLEIYYSADYSFSHKREKILVISDCLSYNGGSLAAVYAVKALQLKGYDAVLAAPGGNRNFIHELVDDGLTVYLYHNLNFDSWKELRWMQDFSFVFVNTLQMIDVVYTVNEQLPVAWWIHESHDVYDMLECEEPNPLDKDIRENITQLEIYAVSKIAGNIFKAYYDLPELKVLPFGIPDQHSGRDYEKKVSNKLIFAIIGFVMKLKGHDVLLDAVKQLEIVSDTQAEFWIIGDYHRNDAFAQNIVEESGKIPNVILKGSMTRKELEQAYKDINVVVCASREETMSMAIMEGMMFEKVCVTSDATGIADFIQNGENGFVFESEDPTDLSRKLSGIINEQFNLEQIGKNARNTYLENFTMEEFGDCLEQILRKRIIG